MVCVKQIWLCWGNSSFALIYRYCTMAIKETNTKRALYLHGLTLIPTWISNLAQMRRNAQHINIIQIFFAMIWGNCNWNIYFVNLKNIACCSQCNLEMIDKFLISGKSELKNKKNIPDWVFLSCSNIIYFWFPLNPDLGTSKNIPDCVRLFIVQYHIECRHNIFWGAIQ